MATPAPAIAAPSPRTLLWQRMVAGIALCSALSIVGLEYAHGLRQPGQPVVGVMTLAIFWAPSFFSFFGLCGKETHKSCLAVAVGMGCVQFLLFAIARETTHLWEIDRWIQVLLRPWPSPSR